MTFADFLKKVRSHIGNYCPDEYWEWKYKSLPDKSDQAVNKEMPFLAVNAVGDDYASKMSGRRKNDRRRK